MFNRIEISINGKFTTYINVEEGVKHDDPRLLKLVSDDLKKLYYMHNARNKVTDGVLKELLDENLDEEF